MKISTEILEKEIRNTKNGKIAFSNIVHTRSLRFERAKLMPTTDAGKFQPDTVYICTAQQLPTADRLGNGCCVVCAGMKNKIKSENYKNVNLLITENEDFISVVNLVLAIFEKYNDIELKIINHFNTTSNIGDKTLELFCELVGQPLCMMDANYNSFAFTRRFQPVDDKLWDYLIKGYGYHYYDIVCKSKPRLEDVAKSENGEIETINNIGGHVLRVKTVYSNGVPIAFLGMHSIDKNSGNFDTCTVQLFDYVVECLQKNANLLKHIQKSRGKPHEQFMEDLLSGKYTDAEAVNDCMEAAEVSVGEFYMLGLAYFGSEMPAAYNHIAMMDYIEGMFGTSKCVKYENYVVVITALNRDEVFENKIKISKSQSLLKLFENCNAKMIFSWPYTDVMDSSYIYQQLKNVKNMEMIKSNSATMIDYSVYSIAIIMDQMQRLHIIGALGNAIISKLVYYDKVNNTELYLTFKQYLKNKCSVAITSDIMHLHRNTLQYRLKQIETLTNVDFDDSALRRRLMYAVDATDYMNSNSK